MFKATELFFRQLADALGDIEIEDEEQLNDFIEQFNRAATTGETPNLPKSDASKAYELYLEAMEQEDNKESVRLLRQAIKLDGHCYDAKRALALLTKDGEDLVRELQKLRREAENYFADELADIRDEDGINRAWMHWDLRPYMRLVQALAQEYFDAGRVGLSICEMEYLLEINPNDNQGIRDLLVVAYSLLERVDDALTLYRKYNDIPDCWLLTALSALQYKVGDLPAARKYFKELIDYCPGAIFAIVSDSSDFMGEEELGFGPSGSYAPGTVAEMLTALETLTPLLIATPGYLPWIMNEYTKLKEKPTRKPKSKARSKAKSTKGGKRKS